MLSRINTPVFPRTYKAGIPARTCSFTGLIPKQDLDNMKMYVFDLDKTLLNGSSDDKRKIIGLVHKPGNVLVYASRRSIKGMQQEAGRGKDLPLPNYYIAIDGQKLYKNSDGQMLEIAEYGDKLKEKFPKNKILNSLRQIEEEAGQRLFGVFQSYDDDPALQIMIKPGYQERVKKQLCEKLQEQGLDQEITCDHLSNGTFERFYGSDNTSISRENKTRVEKLKKELGYPDRGFDSLYIPTGTKGQAAEYIMKQEKIEPEQLVSVGDGPNDASLAALTKNGSGTWFIVISNAAEGLQKYIQSIAKGIQNLFNQHIVISPNPGAQGILDAIDPENPYDLERCKKDHKIQEIYG